MFHTYQNYIWHAEPLTVKILIKIFISITNKKGFWDKKEQLKKKHRENNTLHILLKYRYFNKMSVKNLYTNNITLCIVYELFQG